MVATRRPAFGGWGAIALAAAVAVGLAGACGDDGTGGGGEAGGPGPACEAAPLALDSPALTVDGPRLLDAAGREVLLRGVNAGGRSKLPPFFPFPFAESGRPEQAGAPPFADAAAAYVARIDAWGHDAVRLPFSWEALEPERGVLDTTWLGRYEALVDLAGAAGLRVIVDFHQDVFARPFCGDGFPLWAVAPPPPETPEDCSAWFSGYLGNDAVDAAYDRFWAGEDGLRDAFRAMWRTMAARFADHPAVIGFEIINEPHRGSTPEAAWVAETLVPFYEEIAALLREEAPGKLVLFDATGFDAVTQETKLTRPAGDDLVFAPHFYAPSIFLTGTSGDFDVAAGLGRWAAHKEAWDLPVLVGELGIRATSPEAAPYLRANLDALDTHLLHGTAWEYSSTVDDWNDEGMSFVGPDGAERPFAAELVRAYPRAVAGRIAAFAFDRDARAGTLTFDAVAGGTTEIAAPARLYPDGVSAAIEGPEGCAAWDEDAGVLAVRIAAAGRAIVTFGPAAPAPR